MIHGVEAVSLRKKKKKYKFVSILLKIVFFTFLFYLLITHFLVFPLRVKSGSMLPGIGAGDVIIVCPLIYGPHIPFFSTHIQGIEKPERGDIVAVSPPYYGNDHFFLRVFDPVVRFFTLQKISLVRDVDDKRVSQYSVKRIIGLPGDTVKMERFIPYIKPRGAGDFIHESEIIEVSYTSTVENDYFPGRWRDIFPFSGNMEKTILGENEYFLLGDNRSLSSDSYTWGGAVEFSRISGKIILRYWPLQKFGIP
jgi:signal peptidase I